MPITKRKKKGLPAETRRVKAGFTLIEIVLSIALIAIIVPSGAAVLTTISSSVVKYNRISTALNFAKDEMAIANNLPFSDPSMADGYLTTYPNYEGTDLTVRRLVTNIWGSDNPADETLKKITVMVKSPDNSIDLELDTLRTRNIGFGVPPIILGDQAAALVAEQAGAVFWSTWLYNFSLENIDTSNIITIEKIKIEWEYPPSDSAFSEPFISWIVLNGVGALYLGPGSTMGSGVILTLLNKVSLSPGQKTTINYIQFTTPFPSGLTVDFIITFYMEDESEKVFEISMTAS